MLYKLILPIWFLFSLYRKCLSEADVFSSQTVVLFWSFERQGPVGRSRSLWTWFWRVYLVSCPFISLFSSHHVLSMLSSTTLLHLWYPSSLTAHSNMVGGTFSWKLLKSRAQITLPCFSIAVSGILVRVMRSLSVFVTYTWLYRAHFPALSLWLLYNSFGFAHLEIIEKEKKVSRNKHMGIKD